MEAVRRGHQVDQSIGYYREQLKYVGGVLALLTGACVAGPFFASGISVTRGIGIALKTAAVITSTGVLLVGGWAVGNFTGDFMDGSVATKENLGKSMKEGKESVARGIKEASIGIKGEAKKVAKKAQACLLLLLGAGFFTVAATSGALLVRLRASECNPVCANQNDEYIRLGLLTFSGVSSSFGLIVLIKSGIKSLF